MAHLPGAIHIWLPKLDEEAPGWLERGKPVVVHELADQLVRAE